MNILLFSLYWLSSLFYIISFIFTLTFFKRIANLMLIILLIVHGIFLFSRLYELSSIQVDGNYFFTNAGVLSVISFFILLTYALLEFWSKNIAPSIFLLPLASLIQTSSFLITQHAKISLSIGYSVFEKYLLGIHVLSAIIAYTFFIVSTIFALLYLLLFKNIKEKKFSFLFQKFPSLERTNSISYILSGIAYVLLGLSVTVGFVWNTFQLEKITVDVRIWLICFLLFSYTIVFILYLLNKIHSLFFAISLLVLFWFVLLSLLLNIFYPSFHSF